MRGFEEYSEKEWEVALLGIQESHLYMVPTYAESTSTSSATLIRLSTRGMVAKE